MRIWSLHPSLLDPKRLTAVWREGLLGLHCLTGRCVGYRNHPQLLRWRLETLAAYLLTIHEEATERGYAFRLSRVLEVVPNPSELTHFLPVTTGQLAYERWWLGRKLGRELPAVLAHPIFRTVDGGVEPWEKIRPEWKDAA